MFQPRIRASRVTTWQRVRHDLAHVCSRRAQAAHARVLWRVRRLLAARASPERATGRPALPVAALTANAFDEDRKACLAAGFTAFLTKPLDAEQLTSTLRAMLDDDVRAA